MSERVGGLEFVVWWFELDYLVVRTVEVLVLWG